MNRAITNLTIRDVDEEKRELTGWATVPAVDRIGDVVDPLGATFAASIPLLVAHDHGLPVGRVKLGKPTAAGIPFTATLPRISEPGPLKDRVDSAWLAAKYKIVDSVSIGFRVLDGAMERLESGYKFLRYEIMELSLVAVPAAPGAKITATRAATGKAAHVAKLRRPGSLPVVKLAPSDIAFGKALVAARARNAGKPLPVVRLPTNDPAILRRRAEMDAKAERDARALEEYEMWQRRRYGGGQ